MTDIAATLAERGKRYGEFIGHAVISQDLQADMRARAGWQGLASDQREALEMIAHKIARILNGDPDYHDNWHDIAGYATLVANRLEVRDGEGREEDSGMLYAGEPVSNKTARRLLDEICVKTPAA